MSTAPPSRKGPSKTPQKERRAPRGATGSLRWIKGLLGRPIGLQRRGSQWHVVLVDRRCAATADEPLSMLQLRTELRTRLLAHEAVHDAQVMHELVHVHDVLVARGWRGVENLPREVLVLALAQVRRLATEEASPGLDTLTERLRLMQVAAELREERRARQRAGPGADRVEVSETTHEEFQETERSWVGTIAPELPPRGRA